MSFVHIRVNASSTVAAQIVESWQADARLTNLARYSGASHKPAGDVVEADLPRNAVAEILDQLSALGVVAGSGVVLTDPLYIGGVATADQKKSEDPEETVIWRVQEQAAEESSRVSVTYVFFLLVSVALAAIAVLTDSAVLVVGAMVVGPDFAPIAALCTGLVLGRWRTVLASVWLLVWTYALAIAVITLLALLALNLGAFTAADVLSARPETNFIWRPNIWSFIVALLAGSVGVWAMDTNRSSTLVGVFISVTTVPAVGNLALGIAIGSSQEILGSLAQLGTNIAGMIIAGILTLAIQRWAWRAYQKRTQQRRREVR